MGGADEVGHGYDRALLDLLVDVGLLKLGSYRGVQGLHNRTELRADRAGLVSEHVHEDTCHSEALTDHLRVLT